MTQVGRFALLAVLVGLACWAYRGVERPAPKLTWDAARLRSLTAELHDAEGKPAPSAALAVPYRFVYFSASWCPPCRAFTPQLCDFWRAHGGGKDFTVLLVCEDETEDDMMAYMRDDAMPWWGVAFASASEQALYRAYADRGIPDLVLLDPEGRVIADSYVDGRYRGPESVLAAYAALKR